MTHYARASEPTLIPAKTDHTACHIMVIGAALIWASLFAVAGPSVARALSGMLLGASRNSEARWGQFAAGR
ncbi:MAG: hypothetical protein ACI9MR_005181 [Myxococcota bacterium]|jgi:hypothetical protein